MKPPCKIGDAVTCVVSMPPNNCAGERFHPNMRGVVVDIAPKVWVLPPGTPREPGYDNHDEFIAVRYENGDRQQRNLALNFCNVVTFKSIAEVKGQIVQKLMNIGEPPNRSELIAAAVVHNGFTAGIQGHTWNFEEKLQFTFHVIKGELRCKMSKPKSSTAS